MIGLLSEGKDALPGYMNLVSFLSAFGAPVNDYRRQQHMPTLILNNGKKSEKAAPRVALVLGINEEENAGYHNSGFVRFKNAIALISHGQTPQILVHLISQYVESIGAVEDEVQCALEGGVVLDQVPDFYRFRRRKNRGNLMMKRSVSNIKDEEEFE